MSVEGAALALSRQELAHIVPGSPYDFVRRLDADGDKTLFIDYLTQPLTAADDLRFLHRGSGSAEVAVFARKLRWDSEFFGYSVAKLDGIFPLQPARATSSDYDAATAALLDRAAAHDVTYLFAAVDARDVATFRTLSEAGFGLIETRLYYHRALEDYAHERRYAVRPGTVADLEALSATARDMVNPYDRFHADPFISKVDADRLMSKWVEASILEGFADITFVPDVTQQPRAFCTVRYHKAKWDRWRLRLSQPVFSAVGTEFKGWYKKLISEICYHLKELGAQHAYMATQATNSAVVWTWESLGYRYGKSEHILRKIIKRT